VLESPRTVLVGRAGPLQDPVQRREHVDDQLSHDVLLDGGYRGSVVSFTAAKHDWIVATLARLGLVDHQPRRLYQDHLDLDSPDQLAS
ncbi:MAG: hypothetical protein ACJ782_24855, partial [Actinomycetota bacterium]